MKKEKKNQILSWTDLSIASWSEWYLGSLFELFSQPATYTEHRQMLVGHVARPWIICDKPKLHYQIQWWQWFEDLSEGRAHRSIPKGCSGQSCRLAGLFLRYDGWTVLIKTFLDPWNLRLLSQKFLMFPDGYLLPLGLEKSSCTLVPWLLLQRL